MNSTRKEIQKENGKDAVQVVRLLYLASIPSLGKKCMARLGHAMFNFKNEFDLMTF